MMANRDLPDQPRPGAARRLPAAERMQPRPRLPGHIASRVVVLQIASQDGAERAELAQTLQEGMLPPRLPEIPGLQVTARYVAAVRGLRFSGLPRCVPVECGERGLVVGDVCGKGSGCQEYGGGPFHPATRSACCGVRLAPTIGCCPNPPTGLASSAAAGGGAHLSARRLGRRSEGRG